MKSLQITFIHVSGRPSLLHLNNVCLHLCDNLVKVYLPHIPHHLLSITLGIIHQPVDVHLLS